MEGLMLAKSRLIKGRDLLMASEVPKQYVEEKDKAEYEEYLMQLVTLIETTIKEIESAMPEKDVERAE